MNTHSIKKLLIVVGLSIIVGMMMGLISALFLTLLQLVTQFRENSPIIIFFLPLIGVLTVTVYKKFGKGSHKGNNLIIESVHNETHVPFRMAILTFTFTILTHLFGGSAGREGTGVQIGGTLAHKLTLYFKLDKQNKRNLMMAGISAGFGSVFGTPFAGAFFGMEMAFVGKLSYEAFLPCLIASFTAQSITSLLGITHGVYHIQALPQLNLLNGLILLSASILFGLVGRSFACAIHFMKRFYAKWIHQDQLRALVGSLIVVGVMLLFNAVQFSGLSLWLIHAGFEGTVHFFDPFLKFLLTVLTLGVGFQGGEVTPLFGIGASLGGLIGQLTHFEPSLLAAMGLIAVFGCAANTPLTTIFLGCELFGFQAIPYYIFAALISYYISGHTGIYSAQVIHLSKHKFGSNHVGKTLGSIRSKEKD